MDNRFQLIKSAGLLFLGLMIGSTVLVLADWQAPNSNPPYCPSGSPGCDAPINVSGSSQAKQGALTIGDSVLPQGSNALEVHGGDTTMNGDLHVNAKATIRDEATVNGNGVIAADLSSLGLILNGSVSGTVAAGKALGATDSTGRVKWYRPFTGQNPSPEHADGWYFMNSSNDPQLAGDPGTTPTVPDGAGPSSLNITCPDGMVLRGYQIINFRVTNPPGLEHAFGLCMNF